VIGGRALHFSLIFFSTGFGFRFYNVHVFNICCSLRSEARRGKGEAEVRKKEACVATFVQSVPLKLRRDFVCAGESALQLNRGAGPFDRSTDLFPFRPHPHRPSGCDATRRETTRDDAALGVMTPARGGTYRFPVY